MIRDPDYITWLRCQYRCQDVLNLLHLSSVGIGWHLLTDLALTFGGHRATINQSMLRLRRHGLVEYASYGAGGTFVWWLKRHPHDQPDRARDYPRWVLRDLSRKRKVDVLLGEQAAWAQRLQVHPGTMRNFLAGRTRLLLGRYELAYDPAEWLQRKCFALQQGHGDGLG